MSKGFEKFSEYIGSCGWDDVIEAGVGDPSKEQEQAIMDGGFWGKEISAESIKLLNAGGSYREIEKKRGKFVFRCNACDGRSSKSFKSKEALLAYAKTRGRGDQSGQSSWVSEMGTAVYSMEGATYAEVFGAEFAESL